jgi:FHA domain
MHAEPRPAAFVSAAPPVPAPMPATGLGGTVASAGVDPGLSRMLLGFLVSYDNNALGQSWAMHRGMHLLGRAGAASSAAIEIPHATVSSRHATLNVTMQNTPGSPPQGPGLPSVRAARVFLLDHGSTNGTYVNDAALVPEQQCELQDGDRVRLGLFNLIVKII